MAKPGRRGGEAGAEGLLANAAKVATFRYPSVGCADISPAAQGRLNTILRLLVILTLLAHGSISNTALPNCPFTSGEYIASACVGGSANLPGVVRRSS